MYETLEQDLFIPSIEAIRDLPANDASTTPAVVEEIAEFVQPIRDMEVAIHGLCSFVTGEHIASEDTSSVFSTFVDRYQRNLARLSQNLHLSDDDRGQAISIKWQDLSRLEKEGVAETLLSNMQGLVALQIDTKTRGNGVTKTDINYIKPYHTAEGLRQAVSEETSTPLTAFDLMRIYMRNKYPDEIIQSVSQAYERHKDSIDTFEFRELFLRQGREGISDEAIIAYKEDRDVLSQTFHLPAAVASLVALRYGKQPEQKLAKVTQLVTMIQLIQDHISRALPNIEPSIISDLHLSNYINSGYVIDQLTSLEIDDYDDVAKRLASIAINDLDFGADGRIGLSRAGHEKPYVRRAFHKTNDQHRRKVIAAAFEEAPISDN
jgi:hypothetical protein